MTVDLDLEREALQLLRRVLDAAPESRSSLLAEASHGNAALAARVQALLAQVEADEAIDRVGVACIAADDVAGGLIGPYRVLGRIGRGGMGEVFRARRDDGAFDREVALKRIAVAWAPLAARFQREREVLARLVHPGIAQLYDGGVTADGRPWFAMELVDGAPITQWCDARRADVAQRVALVREVCGAVDAAHRALVVHRDLKPANVLVGADGRAKLLDFGIAKLLDDADPQHTQTLAMTPAWAAPEQRDGRAVTTVTDVWQLGMLLRVLLVGELPAAGHAAPRLVPALDAQQRRDPAALQACAHARGTTPPRLRAMLAGDLECIAALATAEDPARRYPSALALAEDLQRWADGLPVRARRDERGYRLRRALRRHWPTVAALGTVATLAIGFGIYHVDALQAELERTQRARNDAEHARVQAERERVNAQATASFLLSTFRGASPGEIADGALSVRTLLERSRARLAASDEPPAVRGALMVQLGRVYLDQSMLREGEAILAEAVRVLRADPAVPPGTLADALRAWSESLYRTDRLRESLEATREAVRAVERSPERGTPQHAGLLGNVAVVEHALGDTRAAMRTLQQSTAILSTQVDKAPRVYGLQLNNLASFERDAADYAAAERHFRDARGAFERMHPRDPDLEMGADRGRVSVLIAQGKLDEAATLMRTTLTASRRFYGPHHVEVVKTLHDAVILAIARGEHARAQAALEEARAAMAGAVVDGNAGHADVNAALQALLVLERDGRAAGTHAMDALADRHPPGEEAYADAARAVLACMRSADGTRAFEAATAPVRDSGISAQWYVRRLARFCMARG